MSRLFQRAAAPALAVASLLLAAAPRAHSQASVVPTDIQQPGTQPGEVTNIQSPDKCDNCHGGYDLAVEPAHNWRGSMMSHAGRDPLFWATVAIAEQDFSGSGDLCLRCHATEGWLGGRSTPTDGSALTTGDADGVTCDQCHRTTNPDGSEWFGVQNAPFLAHDGALPPEGWYGSGMLVISPDANLKLGPYQDANPNHNFGQSRFHRDPAFCGSCHDVSNPAVGDLAPGHGAQVPLPPGSFSGVPGAPVEDKAAFNNPPAAYGVVERTFSEHMASGFPGLSVADYSSLPAELQDGAIADAWSAAMAASPDGDYVDGAPRRFTCQACHMPPVTGKGCNKASAPVRSDLPHHDLTGGSSWMPDLMIHMDGLGQLVLGGGMGAGQLAALADGKQRALDLLQSAASLQVDDDVLIVTNLTGHKLLSGYPEGRRLWVHVTWRDGGGAVLREDGAYGPLAVTIDGQPALVDTLLDPGGEHTHIFGAHYGMTQEWAALLVSLGWPTSLALEYDRETGAPSFTLGDLMAMAPGSAHDTFHFVLNDTVLEDHRIPPYGMRYDDAQARNILPVPETQYGDPGPGGVYEHRAELALVPPAGAVEADIELLYQSTSWEYVQFLHEANDGSVAFLADTGSDLLDGWLATGMAAPVVVASTTWTGAPSPWTELPGALDGTAGAPELDGTGTLVGGTSAHLDLSHGLPGGAAWFVVGLTRIDLPFKKGLLVPQPDFLIGPLPIDGVGQASLPFTWPVGVPPGVSFYSQVWIPDVGGPAGFAASNGLQGSAP